MADMGRNMSVRDLVSVILAQLGVLFGQKKSNHFDKNEKKN